MNHPHLEFVAIAVLACVLILLGASAAPADGMNLPVECRDINESVANLANGAAAVFGHPAQVTTYVGPIGKGVIALANKYVTGDPQTSYDDRGADRADILFDPKADVDLLISSGDGCALNGYGLRRDSPFWEELAALLKSRGA